jgi:hypothetical protein
MSISAVEALDVLRRGYRVEFKDQVNGFEWDALVELTSEQEKLRHVVYKNG